MFAHCWFDESALRQIMNNKDVQLTFHMAVSALALHFAAPAAASDIYSAFDEDEVISLEREENAPQEDAGETVFDAINGALSHNPQIRIAKSQFQSAKAERFRAFGQFLPEIEASASYTDDSWRSSSLQTLQDRDGTTVGVTAVQPIFQGLTTFNRFREARNRMTQSEMSLLAAYQQTALDAARAHASVVLARAIVGHRTENLSLVGEQLTIAERRQKAGAQSRTGVEQARMRLAQAQVDLGTARNNLAEKEAAYARITGRAPSSAFAAPEDDAVTDFENLDEAMSAAHEYNPSINAADAGVDAAKNAKNAAKGEFAPRLTVEGSYFKRYGDDSLMVADDEEYQVVARMRMPIFAQGRNIAGLRSAAAAESQELAQFVNTKLLVEETVTRSWRQLAEALARRGAAKSGIDAAALSVKGLQMEYEAGQRTVIDVLDSQRDLVTAQINASQADHDVRVSQYELAAATGLILDAFAEELGRK